MRNGVTCSANTIAKLKFANFNARQITDYTVYIINRYNMVEGGHFNMARLSCSLVSRPSYCPFFLYLYYHLQQKWDGGKALGTRLGILLLNFDMSDI